MKLKTIYHRHYFQLASDNYRARHFLAPFIQTSPLYLPIILFFTAAIIAGYNF